MTRFVLLSFVFLAFAFYELSGGTDFDSEALRLSRIDVPVNAAPEAPAETVIARASDAESVTQTQDVTRVALSLTSVTDLQPAAQPNRDTAAAVLSTEPPAVILPSLIVDRAEITPVDFGRTDEVFRDAATDPSIATLSDDFDVRSISGSSVNVRGGPGTGFAVVDRLQRGDQVEIIQNPGDGWVQLRPLGGGTVGWMAEFLLSDS